MLLNGATSTVGALLLQLGRLLRLRPVAVARPPQPSANNGSSIGNGSSKTAADGAGGGGEGRAPLVEGGEGAWERTVARLKALGAVEVLRDEGSLKVGAGGGGVAGREKGGAFKQAVVGGWVGGELGLGCGPTYYCAACMCRVPCCTAARLARVPECARGGTWLVATVNKSECGRMRLDLA